MTQACSLQGNCALPPSPKVFQLKEAVPKGACVVQVSSNFLTCGSHNTELWLDLVYVLMSSNSNLHDSSAAVLHKDGALWITNSVFQSTVGDSRGIDVNSYDGGDPRLFVSGAGLHGAPCCVLPCSYAHSHVPSSASALPSHRRFSKRSFCLSGSSIHNKFTSS